MRQWFNLKKAILTVLLLGVCSVSLASSLAENNYYLNKTKLVSQQVELLASRLSQAQKQMAVLQQEQATTAPLENVSKQMLSQVELDIAIAQTNRDSISIELYESQQTINRIEKDMQEIKNQLTVSNIFGLKMTRNHGMNVHGLQMALDYRKNLLQLEKTRVNYLQQLQDTADNILQLNKAKDTRIEMRLKSHTMMQLKKQQARSEFAFQQQQAYWLQKLDYYYADMKKFDGVEKDNKAYAKLQNDIFYANESVNFTYLQMLLARYQDQLQQMKVSISQSSSITLLSKIGDQTQALGKEFSRLHVLLKTHIDILTQRKGVSSVLKENEAAYQANLENLNTLLDQYQVASEKIAHLNEQLIVFRATLDQALQHELSSRQGLPGFSSKAWVDLSEEILLVPTLAFQVSKSLTYTTVTLLKGTTPMWWAVLGLLQLVWIAGFYLLSRLLTRIVKGIPDHEYGHINPTWLIIKLLHRNLTSIAAIGNIMGLFYYCRVPVQNFSFLTNLGLVWLCFKIFITMARLCLVETVHDRAGHDVRLYHRLKWACWVGGLITACTVFFHQLPIIYELKDLFDRLFLFFLLIVSVFLIKSWEIVPGLILPHIDERHVYMRRIVRLLGILIPLILLVNSAIGVFGFVNLVMTVSWYESIFLFVMVGYLVLRGILNDIMEFVSQLFIRHVTNGWLWTEAVLKPIDRVLGILLFLASWVVLFLFYGWDQQSPVVEPLKKLLYYHLFDVLNTSITLKSILELVGVIALFYWMARWTREFVYRLLLSRTKDLGLRNSLAIFSQYLVIVIGSLICLRVLGIDFRALTVVAGMFSLGIGLGLRDLANNFVCGFLLLIERPLRVGDTVSIADFEGEVTHIGGRAITIRTWDNMEVLVPNAEIFSKSFTNWTAKDNIVRTVISIKINRHDNPQAVQALIYNVLLEQKDVLKDPLPDVVLKEMTDGLLEFEVRYFVNLRQIKSRIGVRSSTLIALWEAFEEQGITPPYPHHEVYVKGNLPTIVKAEKLEKLMENG